MVFSFLQKSTSPKLWIYHRILCLLRGAAWRRPKQDSWISTLKNWLSSFCNNFNFKGNKKLAFTLKISRAFENNQSSASCSKNTQSAFPFSISSSGVSSTANTNLLRPWITISRCLITLSILLCAMHFFIAHCTSRKTTLKFRRETTLDRSDWRVKTRRGTEKKYIIGFLHLSIKWSKVQPRRCWVATHFVFGKKVAMSPPTIKALASDKLQNHSTHSSKQFKIAI